MEVIRGEWRQFLGDIYYRKRKIYSMKWDVDLSRCTHVSAPFGGPIAIAKIVNKRVHSRTPDGKPTIDIFTSAGDLISSFLWEKGQIVQMGWTNKENLVIVLDDGSVMIFSIFGELITQFSLGKQVQQQGLYECNIWGSGVVVLTNLLNFFVVEDFEEPRPVAMNCPPLSDTPASWTIIDPRFSRTRQVQVLVATQKGDILVVDINNPPVDPFLSNGPFLKMSMSPQGNLLACFTASGNVFVTPPDFQGTCYTFPTESTAVPLQMAWCGGDSVVCLCGLPEGKSFLLMVGPQNKYLSYNYYEPLFMIPEIDGMRIISQSSCEIWQLVPSVTVETCKIASTHPSAILYDAMKYFEEESPQADEYIRRIKNDLGVAVKKCVEAAGYEFAPDLQHQLLKAASFGKSFVEFYTPDFFVNTCKIIRVLNAMRDPSIGIPMTYDQFKALTPRVVIDRLLNRHQHLLAYSICDFLKIKPDQVLVHWAASKVKKLEENDQMVLDAIVEKLKPIPGISYAEIASTAYKYGRSKLATRLLDFEPRAADQVPLLISMEQDELALKKAIESGDTDLMYLVLLHIKRTKDVQQFIRTISKQPEALDMFISYCKEQEPSLLPELYATPGQEHRALSHKFFTAFHKPNVAEQIPSFEKLASSFSKEQTFERSVAQEQAALLALQRSLDNTLTDSNVNFVGKTISETLHHLILLGANKQVQKVRETFQVPDKRYWWIKIKALASIQAWDQLFLFSKQKKSPVGFAPFAEVCLDADEITEAVKYIPNISDPITRLDFFIRVGAYVQAATVASKEIRDLDPEIAERIWRECKKEDPEVLPRVEQLLSKYMA